MTIITNYLSYFFGVFASIPWPVWFRPVVYKIYSKICQVDLLTVPENLRSYPSLGDFFVRDLKPGARTIKGDYVSPVDGFLRDQFQVLEDRQTQVKGVWYRITELLANKFGIETLINGTLHNFYLSPKDYHHVHSPCSGRVTRLIHVPGALWPVNNFTYSRLPNLFARNERVIMEIMTDHGRLLLIMVGALNVGKISVTFSDLLTNQIFSSKRNLATQEFAVDFSINVGDRLGTFHLGSSVVLVTDAQFLQSFPNNVNWINNCSVRLGDSLYLKSES